MVESDRWLPPLVERPATVLAPIGRGPRPTAVRGAAGAAGAAVALLAYGLHLEDGRVRFFDGTYWDVTWLPGGLLFGVLLFLALPHVGHRHRDVLLALIPVYGIWLAARVGTRLASLPYRDWRPRQDELPRLRQVAGSDRYYVLAGQAAPPLRQADGRERA